MGVADLVVAGDLGTLPAKERARLLSQWYTDSKLAERMWRHAMKHVSVVGKQLRVIEPTAGEGALILPANEAAKAAGYSIARLVAYDIDPRNTKILKHVLKKQCDAFRWEVRTDNVLRCVELDKEEFDLCVMNPPYEDDMDIRIIARMCFIARYVFALVRSDMEFGQGRKRFWDEHRIVRRVKLPARPTFEEPWNKGEREGGMTDFVYLQIERRPHRRQPGEVDHVLTEDWG